MRVLLREGPADNTVQDIQQDGSIPTGLIWCHENQIARYEYTGKFKMVKHLKVSLPLFMCTEQYTGCTLIVLHQHNIQGGVN